MRLELQDEKGLTGVFIELPLEQLRAEIGLVSSSVEPDAQLKESQGKVTELEGKIVGLEEKVTLANARTMDDFTPMEKATFVLTWGAELSPEEKATFAQAVGIPITGASEAKVAEETPLIINGKTDRPGYKYFPHLDTSIRE